MIVTCPSCASKYRVRDEAVPPGGAELQCPSCSSLFVAHPPKVDTEQVAAALDSMTRARDVAEQRAADADRRAADVERRAADVERRALESERRAADADRRATDVDRRALDAERRVSDIERQLSVSVEQNRRLTDDLARARATAADSTELQGVKQALFEAQKKQKASAAELDVANSLIATLQAEVTALRTSANPGQLAQANQKLSALQAELAEARAQLEVAKRSPSSSSPPELTSLIAAVGPMLWGLEQALVYLEQFSASEPVLAGHVKQLRLLQKVLTRLTESR